MTNQQRIEQFNRYYPVGTDVWYWHSLPFGPVFPTTVTSRAWELPHGEVVCQVFGMRGCVAISYITSPDQATGRYVEFVTVRQESIEDRMAALEKDMKHLKQCLSSFTSHHNFTP